MTETIIKSPIAGRAIDLKQVNDEAFSEGLLGKGIAVIPDLGSRIPITAENSGVLSALFPTGHAFCLTTGEGIEVLVHIGLDTVNLKGQGFKLLKRQGDSVKNGDTILRINSKLIVKSGYDITTPIIVLNSDTIEHFELIVKPGDFVKISTPIFKVTTNDRKGKNEQ